MSSQKERRGSTLKSEGSLSFISRSSSFLGIKTNESEKGANVDRHAFFYDADDISLMTRDWNVQETTRARVGEMGGVQGLASAFRTHLQRGLYPDECERATFSTRRSIYGKNEFIKQPAATFLELCWEALHDPMLVVLIVAAIVSLIGALIMHPGEFEHTIDGLAILISVVIVTLVTAANDYKKEKQFREMDTKKDEVFCIVIRGGQEMEIANSEVNVGDLIVLRTGFSVPCDGVYVTGTENLKCEESAMTGEALALRKSFKQQFLLAGTKVVEGEGVMLGTSVGARTQWGSLLSRLQSERDPTPLQEKLDRMATIIGYFGTVVAALLFIILMIAYGINGGDEGWFEAIGQAFGLAVTIVVVAIPEGLPLAVTISLAYSMKKMYLDNNFVRVLAACETMGNATTICSDKTGTLTQNIMTVNKCWVAGEFYENATQFIKAAKANQGAVAEVINTGLAINSKVFAKPAEKNDPPGKLDLVGGNETECALMRWAIDLGCDYEQIRSQITIEKAYPFSSEVKRSSVLVKHEAGYRLYVKGAAERVFAISSSMIQPNGSSRDMTDADRSQGVQTMERMARTGLRCICVSYKDIESVQTDEEGNVVDPPFEDLVCLAIVGIKDPVRPEVPDAVLKCHSAGICVRMVTGDHKETARFIAKECHIITDADSDEAVMEGKEFRLLTPDEMNERVPILRVLARSTPDDKERLVAWLKRQGQVTAVTGDGANDALALKEADVGLAMGITGTDVAKEASDIIIMDDNFSSIVKTVMWGRSVYDNIRKFVQFQVTVNVVALTLTLIGTFPALADENAEVVPPFVAVQLLWVNLIMDTMAALALGTEMPTMELLDRKPYRRSCSLISRTMWRNIFGHSVYQLTVCLVLMFGGRSLFTELDTCYTTALSAGPGGSRDDDFFEDCQSQHNTIVFNAFVWMTLFNEINSRKCNGELNVFERFFDNMLFTYVLVVSAVVQFFFIEFFGAFSRTVSLATGAQSSDSNLPSIPWAWPVCILLGLGSLLWNLAVRLIPVDANDGFVEESDMFRKVIPEGATDFSDQNDDKKPIAVEVQDSATV